MRLQVAVTANFLLVFFAVPGSHAQEPQSPAAQEVTKLTDLLAEAERVHPAIKAEAQMVESKKARISQAKALPDPTVTVGWMGNITPFSEQHLDPSSYRNISAMQDVPYPGKLTLRGQIAQKDVEAEKWNKPSKKK